MNIRMMKFLGAKNLDLQLQQSFKDPLEGIWRRILENNSDYKEPYCSDCNHKLRFEELNMNQSISLPWLGRGLSNLPLFNDLTLKFICDLCNREFECKGEGFSVDLGTYSFTLEILWILKETLKGV